MNALALDCATSIVSVGLSTNEGTWHFEVSAGLRHSERLLDLSQSALAFAGIAPHDLDLVACMHGPGSFTGLRIGFSTAKGISTALGIPLVSIPTLDCMAKSVSFWPGVVVPVIDAKKACYYTALYEQGKRNTEYLDIGLEYLLPLAPLEKPMLFTGPDAESVAGILAAKYPGGSIHCDPRGTRGYAMELLECAMIRFKESGLGESDSLGPLYLRKSDAEMVQETRSRADRG